jgi:hypothetical protein
MGSLIFDRLGFKDNFQVKKKMILQGDGGGKNSSPHLVNILGTKSLPKWGGMIQIGSSYNLSSILVFYGWKKMGGIELQVHFCGRSQFGKLGYRTFQSDFESLNRTFGGFSVQKILPHP